MTDKKYESKYFTIEKYIRTIERHERHGNSCVFMESVHVSGRLIDGGTLVTTHTTIFKAQELTPGAILKSTMEYVGATTTSIVVQGDMLVPKTVTKPNDE